MLRVLSLMLSIFPIIILCICSRLIKMEVLFFSFHSLFFIFLHTFYHGLNCLSMSLLIVVHHRLLYKLMKLQALSSSNVNHVWKTPWRGPCTQGNTQLVETNGECTESKLNVQKEKDQRSWPNSFKSNRKLVFSNANINVINTNINVRNVYYPYVILKNDNFTSIFCFSLTYDK